MTESHVKQQVKLIVHLVIYHPYQLANHRNCSKLCGTSHMCTHTNLSIPLNNGTSQILMSREFSEVKPEVSELTNNSIKPNTDILSSFSAMWLWNCSINLCYLSLFNTSHLFQWEQQSGVFWPHQRYRAVFLQRTDLLTACLGLVLVCLCLWSVLV